MPRRRPPARALALVLTTAWLAACTSSSAALLDPADFPSGSTAGSEGQFVESHLWCRSLSLAPYVQPGVEAAVVEVPVASGSERYGAVLLGSEPGTSSAASEAQHLVDMAGLCEQNADDTHTIEPVTDLGEDVSAWRLGDPDGTWSEIAIAPVDERRVLVVGLTATAEPSQVSLGDLLAMARANVGESLG